MPTSSTSEYEDNQSEGSDDEEAAVRSLERFYNIFQEPSKQADLNQRMGEVC